MGELYRITKRIREAHKEILETREDLQAARSLKDGSEIRSLKRREKALLALLKRNAKIEATLE